MSLIKTISVSLCFSLLAQACLAQEVIPLWAEGAPGFEQLRNEPEQAKDWWVKNIHNPSLTVFLPDPAEATGAAVLVAPGGGHRELVFGPEGVEAARHLNPVGVAVFVLKYRLAREEGSPYRLPEHAQQDATRAMRLIRSRADDWKLDPKRIGVMGFSAGGEVAAFIAYDQAPGDPSALDPVERFPAAPNFQVLVYPGPLGIPTELPGHAPPAFMVAAFDDPCCVQPVIDLLGMYKARNIPVEVHIYARGGHGFNLGQRSEERSLATWPERLIDWLRESGIAVKI